MGTGKKVLIGCGGIVVLIVFLVGGFWLFILSKQAKYDPMVAAYLEEFMPALETWEVSQISKFFAPQVMEGLEEVEPSVERLFDAYRNLGSLKSYDSPQFVQISRHTEIPYPAVIKYRVCAEFENDDAVLDFIFVRDDTGQILVWYMNIGSNALLAPAPAEQLPLDEGTEESVGGT